MKSPLINGNRTAFDIADAYYKRKAEERVTKEEEPKEEKKQGSPSSILVSGDFLKLENIVCQDADGNIFEQYPELHIRKDVFRANQSDQKGNATHQKFTPYQAIVYCEQQDLFLPSFALSCNILAALYQKRSEPAIAKVLEQYKDHGAGYGWHCQNTIVHWAQEMIIHYPQDSDFPVHGGQKRINSAKPRKPLQFKKAGFPNADVNTILSNSEYLQYLKNLTGLRDPSVLVKIGKYFQKEARVWVSSSNEVRAAWLGCYGSDFVLSADYNLGDYDAARGVRATAGSANAR